MVVDVLPIYDLLVNNLFGSILLAIIGVGLAISLILFVTRTSGTFLIYWLTFYFMVMFTFYFGTLALILMFIASFGMIVQNILAWIQGG